MINFFWYSDTITDIQRISWNSFLKYYNIRIFTYANSIDGFEKYCCDASIIMPQEKFFILRNNNWIKDDPTVASDVFRYKMLSEIGQEDNDEHQWWVDSDMVLLKPLPKVNAVHFNTEYNEDQNIVNTCSCICVPYNGKDIMRVFYESCNHEQVQFHEYGSKDFLEGVVDKNNLEVKYFQPEFACPISWRDIRSITVKDFKFTDETHMVHLFNSMWRWGLWHKDHFKIKQMNFNTKYNPNTFIEKLKKEFLYEKQ